MSTEGEASEEARQNLITQGSTVAGMTLLSRISGFGRDIVLSYFLGASGVADAFFVAFRIPNFFRRLFAEGAFSQAFVPVLSGFRSGPRPALARFVAAMSGDFMLALAAFTVVGMLAAPLLVLVFAPGFTDDPSQRRLTVEMVRITFPYLAFISLTAFAGALLNSFHRYAVPAFTPVLLNLTLIGAALVAAPAFERPVMALAWGVLAAGIVQLVFQLPALKRLDLLFRPRLDWQHPGVRSTGRLMLPAVFASSVHQVNALIDTAIASLLTTGSISWLYYADRLMELPLGLVAVALGTVLLPNLSRLHERGDDDAFAATLDWGVRMGLLWALPATVALFVLALPLVSTIFQQGELTAFDAGMAAAALKAYAVGLIGLVLVKIFAPGYFARLDTRTPFRIGVVAVAVNVAGNLAMFWWLGHVGLALATSLAALVNAGLLFIGLRRGGHYRPDRATLTFIVRLAAAAAVMVAVLLVTLPPFAGWPSMPKLAQVGYLAAGVAAGGAAYLASLLLLGLRPSTLRHRV